MLLFYFYFKQYRNFSVDFAPDFSGLYRLSLSNSLAGMKEESSLPVETLGKAKELQNLIIYTSPFLSSGSSESLDLATIMNALMLIAPAYAIKIFFF